MGHSTHPGGYDIQPCINKLQTAVELGRYHLSQYQIMTIGWILFLIFINHGLLIRSWHYQPSLAIMNPYSSSLANGLMIG